MLPFVFRPSLLHVPNDVASGVLAPDEVAAVSRSPRPRKPERRAGEVLKSGGDTSDELRALTGNLFHAVDDERRRLAREIHDNLSQQIAHIEFHLESLAIGLPTSRREIRAQLEAIRGELGEFLQTLRSTAHRLHPATIEHLDFAAVVRSLATEFSKRTGVSVAVKCTSIPTSLPPGVASSLSSIIREALNNVHKHAGPKAAASVEIRGMRSKLTLSIRDVGAGFNAADARSGRPGLGLISMRERALQMNGSFSIQSIPGNGVAVRIIIPTGRVYP